jgi:rod shape-determining protein MreC
MENVVIKHRNLIVLVAVLFAQVIGLGVQVRTPMDRGSMRLIRLWTITAITPLERVMVHGSDFARSAWRNYFYLRDVRSENQRLRDENARLRLEQVRMAEDAGQARRLQALLKFKEQFISETVAAQVIGSSGSEQSRVVYVDKGSRDGIKTDMAVITPTGVVGKVMRVFPGTAQVLEINDATSGVGAILEKSRLQGIVRGTQAGEAMLHYVMVDEKVEAGEMVLTSGGDHIYPKGLPVGRVTQVNPGTDMFLNIRIKAAARLDRLEEVLIITKVVEKEATAVAEGPRRASEILAQRLPTVLPKPPEAPKPGAATPGVASTGTAVKPPAAGAAAARKPATTPAGTPSTEQKVGAAAPKPANGRPSAARTAATENKPALGATPEAAKPKLAKPAGAESGANVIPGDSAAKPKPKPVQPKPATPKPVAQSEPAPPTTQ